MKFSKLVVFALCGSVMLTGCGKGDVDSASNNSPSDEVTQEQLDQEYSQALEDQKQAGKDATKAYIALLKEAEEMAQEKDVDFLEVRDHIQYADHPNNDKEGNELLAKGEDYKTQLETLKMLDDHVKGLASGPDNLVREEVKQSSSLANGSEKLNKLMSEMSDKYFEMKEDGVFERMAESAEEEKRVGTEGFDPHELKFTFEKGVNNYGEVIFDGAASKMLEGQYDGGYLELAVLHEGICIDVIKPDKNGSFSMAVESTILGNEDETAIMIVGMEDVNKGDSVELSEGDWLAPSGEEVNLSILKGIE